jgi:tetratricopeptide (TPR) repeat protein
MPARSCLVFAVAMALSTMGLATGAHAECSPGQMQEAQIQFQSAQQLLQTQQWRQAVPQLTSIVQFCEEYFPALRGLGLAHYQLGQYAEAADAYERVIEVRGNEADAGDHANLARALAKQKKYKEARAEYIKAKTRDAKNQAVLVNLGILHAASGFPEDAVDTFQDALTYYPELADRILPQLAKAAQSAAERQKKLGNTGRAREYEQIARDAGGAAGGTTAYRQVQERMRERDFQGALELCDRILADDPDHVGALLTKARAADALGKQDVAIGAYREYLEQRPDNMDEVAAMIIVMAEAGRCQQAVAEAKDAVSRFAGTGQKALGKIHFAYGKALFCAEDYAAARSQFATAARSGDPDWTGAAREGMTACDEYLNYEAAQRERAAQQGG